MSVIADAARAREAYLVRCLDGIRFFLSRFSSEVRDAREAADNLWQVLDQFEPIRPLSIAYYLFDDSGDRPKGKILSQLAYLQAKGHDVSVLFRGGAPEWVRSAVPDDRLVEVPPDAGIDAALPEVDVLVGTSWTTAWDIMLCKRAEPVLLETEDDTFRLFANPTAFGSVVELPVPIACVSEPVRTALVLYGRSPALVESDEDAERIISLAGRMHRSGMAHAPGASGTVQ